MDWNQNYIKRPYEEIDPIAIKAKEGDEKALDELLEYLEPIIHIKALKIDQTQNYIDEMVQMGLLQISLSLEVWDKEKSPFERFFDLTISRAFSTFTKKTFYSQKGLDRRFHSISIEDIMDGDQYGEKRLFRLSKKISTEINFKAWVWSDLLKEISEKAKLQLNLSHYIIFKMYFCDRVLYQEIRECCPAVDNFLYGSQKHILTNFLEDIAEEYF